MGTVGEKSQRAVSELLEDEAADEDVSEGEDVESTEAMAAAGFYFGEREDVS